VDRDNHGWANGSHLTVLWTSPSFLSLLALGRPFRLLSFAPSFFVVPSMVIIGCRSPPFSKTGKAQNRTPVEIKLDPGSKTTGISLVAEIGSWEIAFFPIERHTGVRTAKRHRVERPSCGERENVGILV